MGANLKNAVLKTECTETVWLSIPPSAGYQSYATTPPIIEGDSGMILTRQNKPSTC
jgi:hypothetical protein